MLCTPAIYIIILFVYINIHVKLLRFTYVIGRTSKKELTTSLTMKVIIMIIDTYIAIIKICISLAIRS